MEKGKGRKAMIEACTVCPSGRFEAMAKAGSMPRVSMDFAEEEPRPKAEAEAICELWASEGPLDTPPDQPVYRIWSFWSGSECHRSRMTGLYPWEEGRGEGKW